MIMINELLYNRSEVDFPEYLICYFLINGVINLDMTCLA